MGKVLEDSEGMEKMAQGKAILTQCVVCGNPFYQETKGVYAIYCSASCKQKAYREKVREKLEKADSNT